MSSKARGVTSSATEYCAGGLSRRAVLTGALATAGTCFLFRLPASFAQSTPSTTAEEAAFLRFSQAITGHDELHPETSRRIYQAMLENEADFAAQARQLAELAREGIEPKSLLARAQATGLAETALAVVAAWYTGTVANEDNPTVVAYAEALMYRPVLDGQPVPTYCNFGPSWWTQPPPPVGISPPVAKTPVEPPTTGIPVPTEDMPEPPKTTPQGSIPDDQREQGL